MSAVPPGGRRERVHAATVQEIKETARRLLVDEGPASVTLRAIAREMGMTAPGLYRYFPSHEDLWHDLCLDTYGEIADVIEAELATIPAEQVDVRLLTAARRFRSWAVAHPREFGLVFGTPLPGMEQVIGNDLIAPENVSGKRFALVFTRAFVDLWAQRRFPVPDEFELPVVLVTQLRAYRDTLNEVDPRAAPDLPLGAVLVFLQCWVSLYGIVTMEVFGHLRFCLDEVDEFFEAELALIGRMVGLELAPPRS